MHKNSVLAYALQKSAQEQKQKSIKEYIAREAALALERQAVQQGFKRPDPVSVDNTSSLNKYAQAMKASREENINSSLKYYGWTFIREYGEEKVYISKDKKLTGCELRIKGNDFTILLATETIIPKMSVDKLETALKQLTASK